MNIDWKARIRNKSFIVSMVSVIVLAIKMFTNYKLPDGFDNLVNMIIVLLTTVGIIIDPSTQGLSDNNLK